MNWLDYVAAFVNGFTLMLAITAGVLAAVTAIAFLVVYGEALADGAFPRATRVLRAIGYGVLILLLVLLATAIGLDRDWLIPIGGG